MDHNNKIFFFIMDSESKYILNSLGLEFEKIEELYGKMIFRDVLLSKEKYETLKDKITELKKTFSSSSMTSIQKNAEENQKWPLLNLVRQILLRYQIELEPKRKSAGYTKEGKKLYVRYFELRK